MKNKFFIFFIFINCLFNLALNAQIKPTFYLPNAHSHNDYTRNNPFFWAYGLGFGSIEVDLFLKDNELFVAHELNEIDEKRTFKKLYLDPILEAFSKSKDGYLYPNKGQLQLLIDPKTDGGPILEKLTTLLKENRKLFDSKNNPKAVKLIISGNRPMASDFHKYDEIFLFDGNLSENYNTKQLERIGLISAPFNSLSKWNGIGELTLKDMDLIKSKVDSVHLIGKRIRFWAAPDTQKTWEIWLKMGIDYINTDKPSELSKYLIKYPKNQP